MLSSEIWSFDPPPHCFSELFGAEDKIPLEIRKHYFNHSVTVILPDTVLVPQDINLDLVKDNTYYKVKNLPVNKLLDKQFIDFFVIKGNLTALSIGTSIDIDNCAAVTPSGHLVLNLMKETYQVLGLEGTQSQFSTERYVVQLNLKNASFVPGKKNYERAVKCLTDFVNLEMDFLFAWDPPDHQELVCPSSLAAYFAAQGFKVLACTPQVTSSRQYNVRLPPRDVNKHELLEWLGAVALGVNMNPTTSEERYLSSYSGSLEETHETQVAILKHLGFFTSSQIEKLFKNLSSYAEKRKDLPWVALHVQGFADSPVSWMMNEHTYHSDGDNNYTVLLRPDHSFSLYKHCSFPKKIKFKLH